MIKSLDFNLIPFLMKLNHTETDMYKLLVLVVLVLVEPYWEGTQILQQKLLPKETSPPSVQTEIQKRSLMLFLLLIILLI